MSMKVTKRCREALAKEKQPSKCKQEFAKEADVNNIIKRMERGQDVVLNPGQFADVSHIGDLAEAMRTVTDAKAAFLELPPEVRSRFANDPRNLVAFLEDADNQEEAYKLGLIKTKPKVLRDPPGSSPAEPAPPSTPPATKPEPKKEAPPPKT